MKVNRQASVSYTLEASAEETDVIRIGLAEAMAIASLPKEKKELADRLWMDIFNAQSSIQ